MLSDFDLMQAHVAALFTHNARGRIVASNEYDPDRAPRLYLGRTLEGNLWRFRVDLPDALAQRLDEILRQEPVVNDLTQPPVSLPQLQAALAAHKPVGAVDAGPAWYFPAEIAPPTGVVEITAGNKDLLQKYFDYAADHLKELQPCFAVVVDGDAIAVCDTVRLTDHAAEAGLNTEEEFRGRGYGVAVTAAWAIAIRKTGRIPMYSTSWENAASRRVASKLGLILYGSDFSIA
jgi:hypothetical protein